MALKLKYIAYPPKIQCFYYTYYTFQVPWFHGSTQNHGTMEPKCMCNKSTSAVS